MTTSREADEALARAKVLIVDDNESWLNLLARLMSEFGVRSIYRASSVAEGRRRFEEAKPDLVLCDFVMPEADGLSLARWMRHSSDRHVAQVPFILLSAETSLLSVRRATCCGSDYFMQKPVQPAGLYRAIVRLLTQRNIQRPQPPCGVKLEETCPHLLNRRTTAELEAQMQAITSAARLARSAGRREGGRA